MRTFSARRRSLLRIAPLRARCPACGRWVLLRGVTRSVVPPHTTVRGVLRADGTMARSGSPCPASCTRVRPPRAPEAQPPTEGGAA